MMHCRKNIKETIRLNRLCWFGHVQTMEENRIPKTVLYRVFHEEDITAGDDFLGLSDQKSSHKHVSNFGRLPSYGHF